mmetsp:Transcript_11719/g.20132  ORF Transcript_11719/g.20132 Transcript_11719/m.20132 type:complete len:111 (-) Transcript_11719:11-343(-)
MTSPSHVHWYFLRTNYRDAARRKLFAENEVERKVLKSIIYNQNLPQPIRVAATERLAARPFNESLYRIHDYCIMSGRSRAVLRDWKVSRLVFRDYARRGMLPGVRQTKGR